ncbi:MAG: amino acid ABC transporter permease [Eggerthellales bacterium]|nr:amino acid ABC transporter permease [Eggerthellales bacterium]
MTHVNTPSNGRLLTTVASLIIVVLLAVALMPANAWGLTTAKCTARTNVDSQNVVQGDKETRINWEGQAASSEEVTGFTFTLPEGTRFGADDVKVTMLTGDDLMERTSINATGTADGQILTIAFDQPAQAGGYFRVEIYHVFFPREGGEMVITGTAQLSDGTSAPIADVPAISVQGVSLAQSMGNWLSEQEWVQAWNSNKFLKLFLNPVILVTSFPVVLKGFFLALLILACAFPLAIPLGLALALMRMSKISLLRGIASVYVNVVRGTPLFLQIYIAFFGLPLAGIDVNNVVMGIAVLAMNSSAYQCEIFRAGIQSIHTGQFEAARSLGMNGAQTMFFVIIPQTVRRVIPTMMNEFILLYKDTSMLAAVGLMEVVMYAKTIVAATGSITPYIVAAAFYLVITLPLASLVGKIEAKLAGAQMGSDKKRKGGKGLFGAKTDKNNNTSEGPASAAANVDPTANTAGGSQAVLSASSLAASQYNEALGALSASSKN